MTRPRAVILRPAERDPNGILQWLAAESQSVREAERFVARLRARRHEVAGYSVTMDRQRDDLAPGLHALSWHGYVFLFRYVGETMHVVRVLHGRRNLHALFAPDTES